MRKQSSCLFKFTNSVSLRIDCPQRSLSHASATKCHGFLLHCPDTVEHWYRRRSDAVMCKAEGVALNGPLSLAELCDLHPGSRVSLGDCTQGRGTKYPERAGRKLLMEILNLKVTLDMFCCHRVAPVEIGMLIYGWRVGRALFGSGWSMEELLLLRQGAAKA